MGWNNNGSIKGPKGDTGPKGDKGDPGPSGVTPEEWSYGPLATANARYQARAKAASTSRLKIAVLSDSTSDGYTGGLPGGSTKWGDVWPNRLAKLLRAQQTMPDGGVGWVPARTPVYPGGYNYAMATYGPPTNTAFDELGSQIGVPGALWLQKGHATNVDDVTYTLAAGATSVDVVITGYGGNVLINGTPYDSTGDRKVIRVTNPGATLNITGASGVGFALLGIYVYKGDETAGVTMHNSAQAAIRGDEVYSRLQDGAGSLKPLLAYYAPDVILICLGSNDRGNGSSAATIVQTLKDIATSLKAAIPNVDLVYLIRPSGGDPIWADACDQLIAAAPSMGASYFDLRAAMPSVADRSIWLSDSTHFTAAGDALAAQKIADYMAVRTGKVTYESVQTQIDASVQKNKLPIKTRKVVYGPGGAWTGNMGTTPAVTQLGVRLLFRAPDRPTRWRFCERSYDVSTAAAKQNKVQKGIRIGEHVRDSSGNVTHDFINQQTLLTDDVSIPGGVDFVKSPWFPALEANKEYVISTGFTQASSAINNAVGACKRYATPDAAHDIAGSPSTQSKGTPLDWYIEYEVDTTKRHFLVLGDSISEQIIGNQGTTVSGWVDSPMWQTWPRLWAEANNALVTVFAINGFAASNLATMGNLWDDGKYTYGDNIDGAIIMIGSNDASASRSLANFQADVGVMVSNYRTRVGDPNAPVWFVSTIPRLGLNATANNLRRSYNMWLATLPFNAQGFTDAQDTFQSSPTSPDTNYPAYYTDGIHPTFAGTLALAEKFGRTLSDKYRTA